MQSDKTAQVDLGDDFDEELQFNLQQILSPHDALEGSFKSKPSRDEELGGLVHYSGKDSPYNVSVKRLIAVDGFEDETLEQRMSLLVLNYSATCSAKDGRYSRIRTWLDFEDKPGAKKNTPSIPTIVAWAPFEEPLRWNQTEPEIHTKTEASIDVGGGAGGVEVKGHLGHENAETKNIRCFDEGFTEERFSRPPEERCNGIRWVLKHNKALNTGVTPKFRIAVLIARESDEPFEVAFGFRCDAGALANLQRD